MNNRSRLKQAWTIAKIELRRAFFSKRAFWVYGLALFPSLIFFGNSIQAKFRSANLSANGLIKPALMESIRTGESAEAVLQRIGKPASEVQWVRTRRVRDKSEENGITRHTIEPSVEARFIRLHVIVPSYVNDPAARIYELEVYGDGPGNLALRRPATSSAPCSADCSWPPEDSTSWLQRSSAAWIVRAQISAC